MYECIHTWEKVITYTQLTMTGEEEDVRIGLCALCGRYLELAEPPPVETLAAV